MKEKLRPHGLSLALFGFFIVFQLGLSVVGQRHYNQQQMQHGQPTVGYLEYLTSAGFVEATMENWESEFLQMFAYVLLTAFLFQKGSAESKNPDQPEAVDRDPRKSRNKKDAPNGRYAGAASFSRFMKTRSSWRCLFCSSCVFSCMPLAARASTATSKSRMVTKPSLSPSIWRPRSSGSSHCKTGRVSFSRLRFLSCSASSCARRGRRNPSASIARTA